MIARNPAGCHVWQAGLYLSQWILNNPAMVEGKRCLELGCGTGLVGVSLVRAGASRVLLSDGNEEAVSNCHQNIEFNLRGASISTGYGCETSADSLGPPGTRHAHPHIRVELLKWGSRCVEADVIVAADVIYDESVLGSLVQQLRMQLRRTHGCEEYQGAVDTCLDARHVVAQQGAVAMIASTVRNPETLNSFVTQCTAAGLVVRELDTAKESHPAIQWQYCQALEGKEELLLHHLS